MESFSWPVPNGKYVVKLHFAETFEGITGPGQRVFSFNVQGQEFKDFDVWDKPGERCERMRNRSTWKPPKA
jgi:alcohol dehydrogenase (cytochrome c)